MRRNGDFGFAVFELDIFFIEFFPAECIFIQSFSEINDGFLGLLCPVAEGKQFVVSGTFVPGDLDFGIVGFDLVLPIEFMSFDGIVSEIVLLEGIPQVENRFPCGPSP